jgi:septal ring factor EnvC (AmiA/AmiB activator)
VLLGVIVVSEFEDKVLELLVENNQRLNNIKSDLTDVKKKANMTHQEVISLREDVTMLKENKDGIEKEQVYQFSKWAEHDRRIDKIERKIMF